MDHLAFVPTTGEMVAAFIAALVLEVLRRLWG
jgi:hypothetical protein